MFVVTFPYGTDTPIYYWPYATIALILLNVIAYPMQMTIPSAYEQPAFDDQNNNGGGLNLADMINEVSITDEPGWTRLALTHGEGVYPWQWLTSIFIHTGVMHLLANMVFLWAFGLVVEGKLGPTLFVLFYLGCGVTQSGIEQLMCLYAPAGYSCGASSAIYALMAACMLFAPQDNLSCFVGGVFFFRPIYSFFGIPILIFGLVYIFWDFGISLFTGFGISTPFLHIMGAAVGGVFGVVLLNIGFVRSDNKDIFALLHELFTGQEKEKVLTKWEKAELEKENVQRKQQHQESLEIAWRSFDTHFAAGNVDAAVAVIMHLKRKDPSQKWKESRLIKIIQHYANQKDWDKVCYFSNDYLENFDSRAVAIRLNLAKIHLLHQEQPSKAIKLLKTIDTSKLDPNSLKQAKSIAAKAKKMIQSGTIEFSDD